VTNRAISALATLFVALFGLLAARQTYIMVVKGPDIAAKPYNPRHALLDAPRTHSRDRWYRARENRR
jgi:hypothetical protein